MAKRTTFIRNQGFVMRVPLPIFLLRRLPRVRHSAVRDDPADMGTDFGLDASIAGWSDSPAARGATRADGPSADDAPMQWLSGPAGRKPG